LLFFNSCFAQVYLNGEKIETLPARGKKYEYPHSILRINKSGNSERVYIRINGIVMFSRYVSMELPAMVTVDLIGKSIELLSSSRESMQYSHQREIDGIIENMLVNPRSMIEKSTKTVIDKYLKKVFQSIIDIANFKYGFESGYIAERVLSCMESGDTDGVIRNMEELKESTPEIAEKLSVIINNEYISEMGYSYIVRRHKNKVPAIDPTTKKAKKIIHFWKIILDEIIKERYQDLEYVPGFDFDPSANGSYTKDSDAGRGIGKKDQICVNPTKIKSLKTAELGTQLFFLACHELSHKHRDYHNEYFLEEYEGNLKLLSDSPKKWFTLFSAAAEDFKRINAN
jgi:hypothetical protein